MRRRIVAALTIAAACTVGLNARHSPDGGALLARYLQGERTLAWPAAFEAKAFTASVSDAIDRGLPGPPETARRATAAFMLEAAAARLDAADISGSRTLLEWACARVRAHGAADDFDRAWEDAALSIAEDFLDPSALEAHVQHTRSFLQGNARLFLAWAVAAEQRTSPVLMPQLGADSSATNPALRADNQARLDATIGRLQDDALERFAVAAANPDTAADARVRTAHIQLARNRPQDALATLAALETSTREGWLIYLARLFRGQALEKLQRPDDAETSFRDALKIGPGGQTATMSLATLLYRRGHREEAESLVRSLLDEADPISDPWWTYWAGSARLWTQRLTVMRGLLQ